MEPTASQKLAMYQMMITSRRFEEAIQAAYFEGKLPNFNMANGPILGEMHLSTGQEPCERQAETAVAEAIAFARAAPEPAPEDARDMVFV